MRHSYERIDGVDVAEQLRLLPASRVAAVVNAQYNAVRVGNGTL